MRFKMRSKLVLAFAAGALACGSAAHAQSETYLAYLRYSDATSQAMEDVATADDEDDVYAGCRAIERTMYNARYTANALVDLIEETKADSSIDEDERARRLRFYREEWDGYDQLAREASNGLDPCAGISYK